MVSKCLISLLLTLFSFRLLNRPLIKIDFTHNTSIKHYGQKLLEIAVD